MAEVSLPGVAQPALPCRLRRVRGSARQRLERAGVIHSTLLLFHNHTASLPRHPAPRPVPAAQTGDACPTLASGQDAALSRCGVILSNPTAGAQQLSPCSKGTCTTSWGCQRSWAPRVPGSAHSPVSAVGDGVSCTTAHIPQFLVEPSTERVIQPWAHETVSVSQCNGG